MKKILNKKFLSAAAVLALSGTLAVGAATLAACGKKNNGGPNGEFTGEVYYVSATGARENDGKTIATAKDPGFINDKTEIKAGDTIFLVPGTYKWDSSWGANQSYNAQAIAITANGAPGKTINFINAALDERSGYEGEETKVTLDFSDMIFAGNNRGVQIYGDYIYWYGIDVCGAGDNGMYIGGSFNTIEYCEFYNNRDSGLQLGREASAQTNINQWPSYNLIKNCTSHNNYDDETYGENADGFAAKLTIGYGNVFDGCIAYRNSDDGWDLYAKADSGNIGCVIIYNCVAFENGYLEYTQEEMHNKVNYNREYDEVNTNSYKTAQGDGNGFKLGGSVMEGDVKMYNCLSFQNRMHGVTDNSNPEFLLVEGVTSYDNSAAIDDNPSSPTFGQVISTANHDTHANIDVARQTYSYNALKNVLSVKSNVAKSLESDNYRGSVSNSLLLEYNDEEDESITNVVKGVIDADTKVSTAKQYTSREAGLVATEVFKALPVAYDGTNYTFNLSGLKDLDHSLAERVHDKYRNADHSINMGDILAVKDDFNFSKYFEDGKKAGSYLNLTKWEDYAHFTDDNLFYGVSDTTYATLLKAKETLIIYTDEENVYQDFDVPTKIQDATIEWSTDSNLLTVGKITLPASAASRDNVSKAEYISIGVTRPESADTPAKLTAKITYLNKTVTKEFNIVIKKDEPSIGKLSVRVAETDEVYSNGDKIIMDAYRQYGEPVLEVANGAYYNGRLLDASQYTYTTTYEYAESTTADFTPVSAFMVNHPGVFRITHNVTLKGSNSSDSITYLVFVASTSATVDIQHASESNASLMLEGGNVSVFRDGYIISGDLTNVTGSLYSVVSKTPITVTAENIKTLENVERRDFRATSISFNFDNANTEEYYIYYALANVDGDITSKVYEEHVTLVEIDTQAKFMKIAGGSKIGSENVSTTIYKLTKDLDFSNTAWSAGSSAFTGVLNGFGHTVSNVTIKGENGKSNASLFSQVKGGTIMNIKFDKIRITSGEVVGSDGGQRTAIIARVYGGYFHNIAITNIYVYGASQRTAGLIGQVYDGQTATEVTQVSLINPIPKLASTGKIADGQDVNNLYYISSPANRVAGLIAFVQPQSTPTGTVEIRVEDCYVETYITTGTSSVSSILAEYDENGKRADLLLRGAEVKLIIKNCISAGVLTSTGSSGRIGGMLGYHKGLGLLEITSCIALHDMYYGNVKLTDSQKNQSPIVGNFNDAANAYVAQCIGLMEEYNTNFGVSMRTPEELSIIYTFDELTFDREEKWTVQYAGTDGIMVNSPYFKLNFLGNWD